MTLRQTLLATALIAALPAAAGAQPISGLYVGAGAGLNNWVDTKSRGLHVHDNDIGVVAVGSLGWGFGNGFRAEIEGNYRNHEMRRLSFNDVAAGRSGYIDRYGAMANVFFDFDLSSFGISPRVWQPYIGGGVGYAWTQFRDARFNAAGGRYLIDDTGGSFAFQGILGGAIGLAPGLALTGEYRYFDAMSPIIEVSRTAGPASTAVPGKFRPHGENHSILVGLRYAFNPPPAPPPAVESSPMAPPPASVARTFLVFFDWDRADLTDRAREIITEAASAARRVSATRIEVAGHADRSGTPVYNQRLSERRAQVVAAELVRHGIRREEIGITAFGESRPLVPTADGVREPQNRRVEIVLR
ncbi:OmpA family protein [Belnapia sp. T6]|uniref:OmpA family protein n=1 Tax=Belnapia mucosa TaxID=2804532 RepID=A0ABS1VA18_9PROT|nr:OmpA family protein [Belnapia mucosa]MBL6458495.1 OmpA family protein [Belnapia mucosa]